MNYFRTCPHCGANLDPGEKCDCQEDKKAPVSATNTDKGGVKKVSNTACFTPDYTTETGKVQA